MHATTPIGRGRLPLFGADRSYSDLPAQIFVLDALHQPDLWKRTGATPETCPPCNRRMPRYDSASICTRQVVPCSGPRSEEGRVGEEGVSTCRTRGSPDQYKKIKKSQKKCKRQT